MARAYANLQDREQALRDVQLAEQYAGQAPASAKDGGAKQSDIYVSTGEALSTLGDQRGAMARFSKALLAPNADRVGVRLAIAQLMAEQGRSADAERQIALAQMEAEAGDAPPPTGDQYIAAADIFEQMHEYELSQSYLERAKSAGASDIDVRVAMANTYLALGETARAAAELAAVSHVDESESDYQYLLAQANVYQQQHHSTQALSAFAAAASAAGEDQTAEQNLLQAGANEGLQNQPTIECPLRSQHSTDLRRQHCIRSGREDIRPIPRDFEYGRRERCRASAAALLNRNRLDHCLPSASGRHDAHCRRLLPDTQCPRPCFGARDCCDRARWGRDCGIVNRDTTDYTINFGVDPTHSPGNQCIDLQQRHPGNDPPGFPLSACKWIRTSFESSLM